MFAFNHFNINVIDLECSVKFYKESLFLKESRRIEPDDGSFKLVFLTDGITGFSLELTWLRDWDKNHYELGDNESHLAFKTDRFEEAYLKHKEMGCISFENKEMGIYFIEDPDGYWIEIVPIR
ncbi:MAG: lactoylglutathione lyase [Ruminococcaceae bacterium]|nr:lactoylglutathione lyase [Oscillospiraceae bacterium]